MMIPDSFVGLRNHPYRLEVQDVTPVSVSLVWSLRPPPLSAIPRNLIRQQKHSQNISQSGGYSSANPSASSPSSQSSRTPVSRLTSEAGVTATRSLNRRVTKVTTLRNASPNKQYRQHKQSNTPSHSVESEDWPSDDGATAVDEDEVREDFDLDHERTLDEDSTRNVQGEDYAESFEDGTSTSAKMFDSGVSVCMNGVPWSQVMMGERGADEAFIVVYGLLPARDYELLVSIEGKPSAVAAVSTTPDGENKALADSAATPAALEQPRGSSSSVQGVSTAARLRAHTPPMQDTEASSVEPPGSDPDHTSATLAAVSASASSTVASPSSLQAAIRRARKEASRAEAALRNEIEAIKRGLDRMSDVDHRSKQKVLALQESIRQATIHAKDIDEEATVVEGERETWEEREREKDEELAQVRKAAEETLQQGEAKMKRDNEDVEAVEKELQKVTKALEDRWSVKDKLEREKVAEAEAELAKMQMEIEHLLQPPQISHQQPQYSQYSTLSPHGQLPAAFVPSQANGRGKGRGAATHAGARGGSRSTSNPSATGTSSRRHQNRARHLATGAHSNTSDEPSHDYHGPSSSSAHGSALNPHNPEFVPSASSPIINRSMMAAHSDYSPSPSSNNHYSMSGNPAYHMDRDMDRNAGRVVQGLGSNPIMAPWSSVGSGVNNNTGTATNQPVWGNTSMIPSPTMSHDIWGAPYTGTTKLPSSNQSPTHALHTKTSVPIGLNSSLLRGNGKVRSPAYGSATRTEDISTNFAMDDEGPFPQRGSAPVSPSFDSSRLEQ